jgi:putative ABC transport system permease protein
MIHYLRALAARLRGLFGSRKVDRELDDEIKAHLRLLAERYVRQGMSEVEAEWAARRQFGNITSLKEANREMRGIRLIDTFFQELRFGLKILRRNPGFTVVAVLTLALGTGVITAIFSVVNAVMLRPLPYRDPDRLVLVPNARDSDFLRWREQAKAFENMAAYSDNTAILTGSGEPERLEAKLVSADLFATLGVAPALGRAFTPEEASRAITREEDNVSGAPVVILSDSLWRRRFGSDPQVIGRAITISKQIRTVIGIMPPGFRFPEGADLWIPLALNVTKKFEEGSGGFAILSVIARLKPGLTLEAARANLPVIREQKQQPPRDDEPGPVIVSVSTGLPRPGARIEPMDVPPERTDGQVTVIWLRESHIGNLRLVLLILFGAVVFVLLIACANVANLLLARAAARQKEMAIRSAIGAGRLRLVRQLLTESLLLAAVGGAAGLLVAKWGVKLLVAMSPAGIERIKESSLDGRVLGFTCLVALLTGLLAGAFPALQASKVDVNETLKAQSTAGSVRSRRGGGLRALPALMIAELSLALVLLIGAGLMIKSFLRLMAVPKGFNPDGVLTLNLSPSINSYPLDSPRRSFYFQEALARVQALPGVQSAGLTGFLPLTAPAVSLKRDRVIEGRPRFRRGTGPLIALNHVTPDYFQTVGIQMRAGRPFTANDGKAAPRVAIINETVARRLFPNEDPIGHRLLVESPATIVGVVGDTRHSGLDQRVSYEVYLPFLQYSNFGSYHLTLAVRGSSDQNNSDGMANLSGLAAAIRNQAQAIDPNEPLNQVTRMDERLSNSVAERRFQTLLLSLFAAVALVIAAVGIYGVISYAVSRRTHEIGVRMALGAQRSDVLRMVIWRGMSLTLAGVTLGLAAALALTRVLKNLLFEMSATDPATFASIAMLLVAVALIASYIPARRATKIDPLQALRHE